MKNKLFRLFGKSALPTLLAGALLAFSSPVAALAQSRGGGGGHSAGRSFSGGSARGFSGGGGRAYSTGGRDYDRGYGGGYYRGGGGYYGGGLYLGLGAPYAYGPAYGWLWLRPRHPAAPMTRQVTGMRRPATALRLDIDEDRGGRQAIM